MGMWGFDLYQNDMTLDIKDEFEKLLSTGKTSQEITDEMLAEYRSIIGDIDEEPLFWFALADTQWNWGVLLPPVKEKALYWINQSGSTFPRHSKDAIELERKQWEKTVLSLKKKLLSPHPPAKKPVKKRVCKCQWNLGDVFAYPMESDLARKRSLYGQYLLIQKVDEGVWYPGHIVPIVYVKITKDAVLPSSIEEYDKLEYVQTGFSKFEERFWPIDMNRPQEDIAEKSKIHYHVDAFGLLPQYRIQLLNTSKRVIPPKLIYVGNYISATRPQNEFVPHSKVNILPVYWKKFNETFESKMIKLYCGHNLREFDIYKKK